MTLSKKHVETIYQTKDLVTKIHYALTDDEELGHVGMITQVKKNSKNVSGLEDRMDKADQEKKKTKWVLLGIGAGAGFGGAKIGIVLSKLAALFGNIF